MAKEFHITIFPGKLKLKKILRCHSTKQTRIYGICMQQQAASQLSKCCCAVSLFAFEFVISSCVIC
jgi:hypothetical protein